MTTKKLLAVSIPAGNGCQLGGNLAASQLAGGAGESGGQDHSGEGKVFSPGLIIEGVNAAFTVGQDKNLFRVHIHTAGKQVYPASQFRHMPRQADFAHHTFHIFKDMRP